MAAQEKEAEGYIYPKEFFQKNKPSTQKGLCFVLMPFEKDMDKVYDDVISKTALECGLTPVRADRIFDTKPIMISVMEKINDAELIVADVTDRNPNVFYELGMTHVLKDKVILIAQKIDDIPFDLRHFRFILYQQSDEGQLKLRDSLIETFRALGVMKEIPSAVAATGQPTPTSDIEQPSPEILSTTIFFEKVDDWEEVKGEMFATLVNWVEYEDIEDKTYALNFPGGTIGFIDEIPKLTLYPGGLSLQELLQAFGRSYEIITFKVNRQFDFGDLARRSRSGTRQIASLSKDGIVFSLSEARAELTIENTGEGSLITIVSTSSFYKFSYEEPPIPYSAVLGYLEKDPPAKELESLLGARLNK